MPEFPECLLVVTAEVDPEVEAEWNRWYDAVHVPDVLACPGVRAGRRYVSSGDVSESVRGKTEQIVATLNPVWLIDRKRTTRGGNSQNINSNTPPVVTVQPMTASSAKSGSVTFATSATDDGLPKRRGASVGMTVEWEKYRGPGTVTFSQIKQPLADGKASVNASFSEPGEYYLHLTANDYSGVGGGGELCCWTSALVKVNVTQ